MDSDKRAFRLVLCIDLAVIAIAIAHGLWHSGNPSRYFGEGRYTTGVSCLQLLLAGLFSFGMFRARRAASPDRSWRAGFWVWLLMGAGFVFLACDDAFQFHERIGHALNNLFPMHGSVLAGRIDDMVIGFYGLIGLWVLWLFRRELLDFRVMLRPLAIGFVFTFLSVMCDTLGHHEDVFMKVTHDLAQAKKLQGWADTGDGSFTLLAEGMFALAFFCGWRRAVAGPV